MAGEPLTADSSNQNGCRFSFYFLHWHFHFRYMCVCVLSICKREVGGVGGRKHEQVGLWRIVPTKMLFFTLFERKMSDSRTPKKRRLQRWKGSEVRRKWRGGNIHCGTKGNRMFSMHSDKSWTQESRIRRVLSRAINLTSLCT